MLELLEEAKGVKSSRHRTQFALQGDWQHAREQEPLQGRLGWIIDPAHLPAFTLFCQELHRRLKAVHITTVALLT